MASPVNSFSAGVTLLHIEQEGKHFYEVKNFINANKGFFAKEGDKILMINGEKMEDITPGEFASLLVGGSPLLTIHHQSRNRTEECSAEEISAYKKEPTMMNFNLMMVREKDLQPEGHLEGQHPEPEWEEYIKEDNLLLVSMNETRLMLVHARGCDPDCPCNNCGRTDCQLNDIVVMPERAEVAFSSIVSDGALIVDRVKERNNLFLKSFFINKYITPWREQLLLGDTMSANITIYYYKTNIVEGASGLPVVLNFTGTNNFFSCTNQEGENKKILRVVCHERRDLKNICADDPEKWSLVFYMSSTPDNLRRFESALHRGWFIYIRNVNSEVEMQTRNQHESYNFYFIIESQNAN